MTQPIANFDWALVRSFLAVLDAGSLMGAARKLQAQQPTLSRHVAELETQLGTPLFERTGRGVTPTAAALAITDAARQMESGAGSLARALAVKSEATTGTVRISTSQVAAAWLLPSVLAALQAEEPGIAIELVASNQISNLLRREADIAVRMVRPAQDLHGVVIRAGDFYGAGSGSWIDQAIVKNIAKGKLVYPGPPDVPHAWAYLPDLARAFVAVAAKAPQGFTRLHFAGHTFTGRELLALVEAAAADLGLRPATGWRHGTMPWGLIRTIGTVYPLWRELARMSYLWRVPHALDGAVLQAITGALPGTTPTAALRQTLVDLGHGPHAAATSAAAA